MRLTHVTRPIVELARALASATGALVLFAALASQALVVGGHVHQDWRIATSVASDAIVHPASDDCGDPLQAGHAQCAICRVLAMGMAGAPAPATFTPPACVAVGAKGGKDTHPPAHLRLALAFRSRAPPV